MEFDINDIANTGAVADMPPYMLPPETWSLALNMRAENGGLVALLGWEQVFGTPTVAPHFVFPVATTSTSLWVYGSLTKIYAFDGTTHTNITRQSVGVDVNYTAVDTPDWNKTLLGGILIVNNGNDVPQFWATPALATKMADLTNWPATHRAKVVRAFGPFLVAGNITVSGTNHPHRVLWSHPADPGSVPVSWDVTDATRDAGQKDLSDVNSGVIREMLPLGTIMYIYKESSIWKMRYIGGREIFDIGQAAWVTTAGILAPRCAAITGDGLRQVFATQDDIMWHDGSSVKSVLNRRQKARLFNEIDTDAYGTSFMFTNPAKGEIWFCYPSAGADYPDKALILNYMERPGEWIITEADGITFRDASIGNIEAPDDETWDDGTDTWEEDTGPWADLQRRRVILAGTAATKLYNLDKGVTRDTTTFDTTLQRVGLALVGKKRDGGLIVDHQKMKMLKRAWPKIQGGPVNVRFGSQQVVDGAVSWGSAVSFDPSSRVTADPGPVSGRAVGIEYSSTGSVSWRIDGYKVDMVPLGDF